MAPVLSAPWPAWKGLSGAETSLTPSLAAGTFTPETPSQGVLERRIVESCRVRAGGSRGAMTIRK